MDRREFLKKTATTFIFTASGLFVPKLDIIRPAEALNMAGFGASGSGGCTYPTKDSYAVKQTDSGTLGYYYYGGGDFVASSNYATIRIIVLLKKIESPTFNINCYIYSDSSGNPGSVIGTSSDTLSASSVSSVSNTEYTFNFAGCDITSSATYWIILKSSTNGDSTNIIRFYGGDTTGRSFAYGDVSWSKVGTKSIYFKTMSCS